MEYKIIREYGKIIDELLIDKRSIIKNNDNFDKIPFLSYKVDFTTEDDFEDDLFAGIFKTNP